MQQAALKVVFTSADYVEAQFIRSMLEGSGVDALVLDTHMSGLDARVSAAFGWIKVAVPEDQVERVRAVFADHWKEPKLLPVFGNGFHPYADVFKPAAKKAARARKKASFACPRCASACAADSNFCGRCAQALR